MEEEKCGVCNLPNPPTKKSRKKPKQTQHVNWICCDNCAVWYHSVCVRIGDSQMSDVQNFKYFCENCSIRGTLVANTVDLVDDEVKQLKQTVQQLSAEIEKLKAELESVRSTNKKQHDRIQSKLNSADQRDGQCASQTALINDIGKKLEVIEVGAKLASNCSKSVNCCRLAINKIPYREGESVRSIVENVLTLLGVQKEMPHVVSCFRVEVKPSKWSDRSITPTIVAVFDNKHARERVIRMYFERYKEAKLCRLKHGPDLEYRFTVNEMLSVHAFRIRNLALRLKQRKVIQSVFVRNDNISVLLPGHQRYTAVDSTEHLLELTRHNRETDDSSLFFDALSSTM